MIITITRIPGIKIASFLMALAVALSLYVIWRIDSAPRTDDAYVHADIINVTPEVSGTIIELPLRNNQQVKRGDLMLRIDPRPFINVLNKARAELVTLEKEIVLGERKVESQVFQAKAAQAEARRAGDAARQARRTLSRLEPLLKQGFTSKEQVDQARTALMLSEAQQAAALSTSRGAEAAISGVDDLVARREVLKAEIAQAELHLEYATLRAPIDGRVVALNTVAGQYASAGHALFTLVDTESWHVIANFRETDLDVIRPGSTAVIYLMADTSKKFSARVDSIGFGIHTDDAGTMVGGLPAVRRTINWVRVAQRFPVKLLVDNPDPAMFRIGASAVVRIIGSTSAGPEQ